MKQRLFVFLFVLLANCGDSSDHHGGNQDPLNDSPVVDGEDAKSRTMQPTDEGGDSSSEPISGSGATEPLSGDQTLAVDVDNPKETGPKPQGGFKLWLADAPSDDIQSLLLDIESLYFIPADSTQPVYVEVVSYEVDLLQYQQGDAFLLFDGQLPVGEYSEVHLQLAQEPLMINSGGTEVSVELASPPQPLTLSGQANFAISADENAEYVWHVPLWKSLSHQDGVYSLISTYPLLPQAMVGAIEIVGLLPAETLAICVTMGTAIELPVLPGLLSPGDFDCPNAAGRALITASDVVIPFLEPGTYVIDVYASETLYVRLSSLIEVTSEQVTLVDLSAL